jgi:uncharacterized membrane protein
MEFLRRRFFAGIVTLIPALITIYAVILLVNFIESVFGPVIKPLVQQVIEVIGFERNWVEKVVVPVVTKALSLVAAGVLIVLVGELTRWFLVRKIIAIGEMLVERIPLISFFYRTPKEVIKLLTEKRSSQKRVVLVQFPREGVWALAYATSEIRHLPDGETYVTVFMPTTPNPTTGFLMLIKSSEIRDFNVTAEDSFRMIISGGILAPREMTTKEYSGLDRIPDLPPPVPLTSDSLPSSQTP